jgi:hypothetical protein
MTPAALPASSHARLLIVSLFRSSPTRPLTPCPRQQSTLRLMLLNGCSLMESSAAIPAGPPHGFIFIFFSGRFSTNHPTYPHSYRNWSGRGVDNSSRAVCRVVQPDTRFLQRPSTYANTLLVLPVKLVSRALS